MQTPQQPLADLTRPALSWRLRELGLAAEDGESPIELGLTLLAALICLLLPLWLLHSINYERLFGTAAPLPGDFSSVATVFLSFAGCVAGALAVSRGIRGIYRRAYHAALTALHSTELPLVVADESMRELVREVRDQSLVRKWLRPAYGSGLESQLRFASRYFYPLLKVARSGRPTPADIDVAEMDVPLPVWAAGALGLVVLLLPFLNLVLVPTILIVYTLGKAGGLQQKARLAALCDFYAGREHSPWIRGWVCRRNEWDQLRRSTLAVVLVRNLADVELVAQVRYEQLEQRELERELFRKEEARVAAGLK